MLEDLQETKNVEKSQ